MWCRKTLLSSNSNNYQEDWISPKGKEYTLKTIRGKSVNVEKLKGNYAEFKDEIIRVKKYVDYSKKNFDFETRKVCPICNSKNFTKNVSTHGINYLLCNQCFHVFSENHLTSECLELYYSSTTDYQPIHVNKDSAKVRVDTVAVPKIKIIKDEFFRQNNRHCNSLLDIGAGAGHIVCAAKSFGINAYGVEPSSVGRHSAKQLFDIDLNDLDFINAEINESSLDMVTFFGVIEHTIDPSSYLIKARKLLKNEGMIFVEIPRHESLTTILDSVFPDMGTRHLEGIEHIHCFSDSSIATLLTNCGLKPCFAYYLGLDWYELIMRISVMFEENRVTEYLLENFNTLQHATDLKNLSDAIIVGCVIDT